MQNWNNILSFIKIKLGSKINLLEISDDDILKEIKEHAIYEFSQYCPFKKRININNTNRIATDIGEQSWVYKIPIEENQPIIDILDVVTVDGSNDFDFDINSIKNQYNIGLTPTMSGESFFGIQDIFMANKYNDIMSSMRVRNTWDFLPPDMISFDEQICNGIVIFNTIHNEPSTIMPDMYHIFKRLCLGYIQETLASVRSKFEELNTPYGQIRINFQKLQEDANTNLQYARDQLNLVPSDHVLYINV